MLLGDTVPSKNEMWKVRDEQQDLEQLWKTADVHKAAIGGGLAKVAADVHSMEEYLGEIWDQWVRTPAARGRR